MKEPSQRRRRSRRPLPTRSRRNDLLDDPKQADYAHERMRQALKDDLAQRYNQWDEQLGLRKAIKALRAALPKVLGEGSPAGRPHLEILARLERENAVAPEWCHTPEDWWLDEGARLAPHAWLLAKRLAKRGASDDKITGPARVPADEITGAARELDDDEIAAILSPVDYRHNRERAITAVRVRRAALTKRRDDVRAREREQRIAELKQLRDTAEPLQAVADPVEAELKVALEMRRTGADPNALRRALRRIEELLDE